MQELTNVTETGTLKCKNYRSRDRNVKMHELTNVAETRTLRSKN